MLVVVFLFGICDADLYWFLYGFESGRNSVFGRNTSFSSPPTQSLFKFELVWLLGRAQGGLCIRLLVSSVACASSSGGGD